MIPTITWPILIIGLIIGIYYFSKLEEQWNQHAKGKNIKYLWPIITNKEIAFVVAFRCAFMDYIFGGLSIFSKILLTIIKKEPIGPYWYIDGITFIIFGYGIQKMSRVAALMGLTFYSIGRIYMIIYKHSYLYVLPLIIVGLVYINAIRATMFYHSNKIETAIY